MEPNYIRLRHTFNVKYLIWKLNYLNIPFAYTIVIRLWHKTYDSKTLYFSTHLKLYTLQKQVKILVWYRKKLYILKRVFNICTYIQCILYTYKKITILLAMNVYFIQKIIFKNWTLLNIIIIIFFRLNRIGRWKRLPNTASNNICKHTTQQLMFFYTIVRW